VGDCPERALERLTIGGDEAARECRGALQGDLLAKHRANRELMSVDVPSDSAPGDLADQGADQRVGAQGVGDRLRVGVEVEERARAMHRCAQVAQVLEPIARAYIALGRPKLGRAPSIWQAQASPVYAVHDLLDAPYDATGKEVDQSLGIQR
jgi:hypothetical protein